jgi:hypothetical protein
METTPNDLVNVHGLARELRIPATWLQQEADAGRIPVLRIGRRRLFNLNVVRITLAERAGRRKEGSPCAEKT